MQRRCVCCSYGMLFEAVVTFCNHSSQGLGLLVGVPARPNLLLRAVLVTRGRAMLSE